MNEATRKRINELPEDAPDSAVIAVWAGYEPYLRSASLIHDKKWVYKTGKGLQVSVVPSFRSPYEERTLRRWLLDGGMTFLEMAEEDPEPDDHKYEFILGDYVAWHPNHAGTGDTPEAAFQSAVAQFASALRDKARRQT